MERAASSRGGCLIASCLSICGKLSQLLHRGEACYIRRCIMLVVPSS